jgi:hypothetical protein
MKPSPSFSNSSPCAAEPANPQSTQRAERTYRDVTIAAMLLLLISLCVFW